jgi:ATP-dependent DNA ligase
MLPVLVTGTVGAFSGRQDSQFAVGLLEAGMSRVVRLRFIPAQLPSLTEHPPEGANWIHEVKHDGYRTMLLVERGTALAYTRNGHDWSDRSLRHASFHAGRQSLMAR